MRLIGVLRRVRPNWRSDEGGALAEAAIVLPVLLLIIFAMIWYGMLIYAHTVVQIAAAQGARVAAAAMAEAPNPAKPAPEERAKGFVRSVVQSGLSLSDLEAIAVVRETIESEEAVRVTVTYRFKLLVPFMSEFGAPGPAGGSGMPVVKSSVYRIEVVNP